MSPRPLLIMAGVDNLHRLLAGIEFRQSENLLENDVLEQIALERKQLLLQVAHARLNRQGHLLVQLAQLQNKEGQAQQLKTLHLLRRGEDAVNREGGEAGACVGLRGVLFGGIGIRTQAHWDLPRYSTQK